jgi:hypothetical protein
MFAFFAGLAAGLLHVFSGPDHLAAVAPLAADGDRNHWRTGLQWGFGHTAGVLMIAALLLLVRDQLPLDAISAYSERIVGVALIAVGGWGMWGAWVQGCKRARVRGAHTHGSASFGMGIVHGLAGSSHLFGVIPALAFATRIESLSYLAGFGAGAIFGMTAFAAGMGLLSVRLGRSGGRYRGLLFASSAAALVVGGFWLVGH